MESDRAEIVRLAALATGDEKHEASSYSTLDALLVAYRDVLRVDPSRPSWEDRDRFFHHERTPGAPCCHLTRRFVAELAAPASACRRRR